MKKRTISTILVALLVLSTCTGCGSGTSTSSNSEVLSSLSSFSSEDNYYEEQESSFIASISTSWNERMNQGDYDYIINAYENELIDVYKSDETLTNIYNEAKKKKNDIIPYSKASKYIKDFSGLTKEPNSAGGVDLELEFTNSNSKTIKYIYFTVTPYNAVDDVVSSEIGGKSTTKLRYTGPIRPNEKSSIIGDCIWYNVSIKYAIISQIDIQYMDGEKVRIDMESFKLP